MSAQHKLNYEKTKKLQEKGKREKKKKEKAVGAAKQVFISSA